LIFDLFIKEDRGEKKEDELYVFLQPTLREKK